MPSVGERRFGMSIRTGVRGLWSGALSFDQAWDHLRLTIEVGIAGAWYEGALDVGITPMELTPDERLALRRFQFDQLGHVSRLLATVEEHSKANNGRLGPLLKRAEMWTNRYRDARNQARTMAGRNEKLMWMLGPTEHCVDCARLATKVKRASQWQRADLRPQSPDLECGGWRCQCELRPTRAPMSRGPLPHLVGR